MLKGKKVIVTGGAGFIGANLLRKLLEKKAEVVLLLKKDTKNWRIKDIQNNLKIIYLDLLESQNIKRAFKQIKPQIVYHLATNGAYSYQNERDKMLTTSIAGVLNLLDASKEVDLELFINTGSSSEYGFKKDAMKEDDILEPNSFYAISKATQTHICKYYYQEFHIPVVTLRPFSVYGPFEEPGRLIPNILKAYYSNNKLEMVGKNIVRDFMLIDDYINLNLKVSLLTKFPGEVFNVGSGKQISFDKLIKISEKSINKKLSVNWGRYAPRKWDTFNWEADMTKTKKNLRFVPKISLESGLKKNWKWFKTNHHFYNDNN